MEKRADSSGSLTGCPGRFTRDVSHGFRRKIRRRCGETPRRHRGPRRRQHRALPSLAAPRRLYCFSLVALSAIWFSPWSSVSPWCSLPRFPHPQLFRQRCAHLIADWPHRAIHGPRSARRHVHPFAQSGQRSTVNNQRSAMSWPRTTDLGPPTSGCPRPAAPPPFPGWGLPSQ